MAKIDKSSPETKYIEEEFQENKVKLNRELKRLEDERPDYTERCKGCNRPVSLCVCPNKDAPRSLND